MKPLLLLPILLGCGALSTGALAANPFLSAADDKPVSAKFAGTEWGDDIGSKDLPLSARVVTTRIAQAPWGAIFKISFENIASRAKTKRSIGPIYYLATDDEIALLHDDQPEAVAKKRAAEVQATAIDPNDVHGISTG